MVRWLRWFASLADLWRWQRSAMPIFHVMQDVYLARIYYLAADLQLADRLADGPATLGELAAATHTQPAALRRVVDVLAAVGVLREDRQGRYHLQPRGRALRSDVPGSLQPWLRLIGRREVWQGFAMAREALETGRSGFELAHGQPFYDYLAAHDDLHQAFIGGMSSWTDWQAEQIVAAYDFARFTSVVDVGGGRGSLIRAILAACPHVRGVLFDRADSIAQAQPWLEAAGVADRCRLAAGDFFQALPGGCDAYVLKHVIRDWDEQHAQAILMNCRQAMPAGGTLLLVEAVVDRRSGRDRLLKLLDYEGSLLPGGRLRSREEFDRLLSAAGFHLLRVRRTALADSWIVEAQRRPDAT